MRWRFLFDFRLARNGFFLNNDKPYNYACNAETEYDAKRMLREYARRTFGAPVKLQKVLRTKK